MTPLLDAIITKFTAASLGTYFTGGLWPDMAPEGTAPPFCTYTIVAAPSTTMYGGTGYDDVQIQFSGHGTDYRAIIAQMESLLAAYKNVTLTLTGAQNCDSLKVHDPITLYDGKDKSGLDVWRSTVTLAFTVRA